MSTETRIPKVNADDDAPLWAGKAEDRDIPPEGKHWGTFAKVELTGKTNKMGTTQVRITWELDVVDKKKDKPFLVWETFWNTLFEGSHLSNRIESLTGEKPNPKANFNLKSLCGTSARLTIEHNKVDGKVYANVVDVERAGPISDADIDEVAAAPDPKFSDDAPELTDEDIPSFFN